MLTVPAELTAAGRRMPHLRLLVLHGSRARGTAHQLSDWDFAYLGHGGFDPDALLAALVDASGNDRVDAVDLDRAGALIRHRVARDGVVVYETRPGIFDEFRLQATQTWCDLEPVRTPLYERVLREMAEPKR